MELKDIEPVAFILVEKRFGKEYERLFFINKIDVPSLEPRQGDHKLYTEEQMQDYAKAQAKKVFWYAAKGTSEDRALLARAIDYVFKEAQDEEI